MIRKTLLALFTLALFVPALSAQTVDEIIAKHLDARGGLAKIKAVNTMKATGKMSMGPMEAPITMTMKRPMMMKVEFTIQGLTGSQAFDGTNGWALMPFGGKKDPEPMTADDQKEFEEQADIDGPLVDYQAKGNKVELIGKEKVEGTDAYKLKITRKNGDVVTQYIDADNFLTIKEESKRTVRGTDMEFETAIGDYKEVSGIVMPFSMDSGVKGSEQHQKITIDKYEVNVPIEDAFFKMPPMAPKAEAPKADPPKK